MNRNIDIEFKEEPSVQIQPVTRRKAERETGTQCNFWVGWQLFGSED